MEKNANEPIGLRVMNILMKKKMKKNKMLENIMKKNKKRI